MLTRNALAVSALVALGSLGLASTASASDASVKAAGDAHDAQFEKLGRQQRRDIVAWDKAGHSRRTSVPLLRVLKRIDRLEDVVTKDVKAQAPSSPTGARAKSAVLRSNDSFSRYLKALGRAVRLATASRIKAANHQLKLAGDYAKRADEQAQLAKTLFAQVL